MERQAPGEGGVEFGLKAAHRSVRPHHESGEHARGRRLVQVVHHVGQDAVAAEILTQTATPDAGGIGDIGQAAAVEVESLRVAVAVEDRLVAPLHDQPHHALEHAWGKRGPGECRVVGGPLDESPRRRDERHVHAECPRDRQGVAIPPPGGEHHPHAGGDHPRHRGAGHRRHLVVGVGERAVDIEHEQSHAGRRRN